MQDISVNQLLGRFKIDEMKHVSFHSKTLGIIIYYHQKKKMYKSYDSENDSHTHWFKADSWADAIKYALKRQAKAKDNHAYTKKHKAK